MESSRRRYYFVGYESVFYYLFDLIESHKYDKKNNGLSIAEIGVDIHVIWST